MPATVVRYHCPSCRGRAIELRHGVRAAPFCSRCGQPLQARGLPRGQLIALSAAAAAVVFAAVPDLLQRASLLTVRSTLVPERLQERFDPPPEPRQQPLALLQGDLLERLSEGDRSWDPRVEYLPNGGSRYLYRRRPGEPVPTLAQLRHRIEFPPTYAAEGQALIRLLRTLQRAGVQLELTRPHKPGAAAEWDAARRTLRIDPTVPDKGTVDFARVLNHEAIHVAQSCRGGGLRSAPRALGIDSRLTPSQAEGINSPIYAEADPLERALEAEAYANQHRLGVGEALVGRYCQLRS